MSGHSKFANIKHKKGRMDAQRGKIFTKIAREILVAAKQGGGDPNTNFSLKIAIQKGKENNMPADNINRTIQKALGAGDAEVYEELYYEGYGPEGVAVMVKILTDSRNRTASEIRYIFSRSGGGLGETGCVAWMFAMQGVLRSTLEELHLDEDEITLLAIDAGAEDVKVEEGDVEILSAPGDFEKVKTALEASGLKFADAEITMVPQNSVEINSKSAAEKVIRLIDALEDNDDVQAVYANFDIDDDILSQLE